jgi:methylmalonyl-CoA mutase N-terminal domain/subunit
MVVDIVEFAARNIPHWYPTTPNMYDMREQGINAAQELAFGFAIAMCYVQRTIERGLSVDDFAPRISFYCSCHIDLFEEVAKLRAARRLWAKIMKERFGAQNPRSMQFRFAVHTAGCSLVPQQPLNNIVRVAYEALAAVLAGCQSLHCCSYDEPIALPSEVSQRIAIRTQQILAYETGVANVSDPLGGSYYVEALTDRLEAETERVLAEIERRGGIIEAMRTEWIDREIEKAALENQRAVDSGEQVLVGVNAFRTAQETSTPGGVKRIPVEVSEELARRTRELKETRDNRRVRETIAHLRREAERGEQHNLLPAIIECVKAYATNAEIIGTIREVYGHHYDPLEVVNSPF